MTAPRADKRQSLWLPFCHPHKGFVGALRLYFFAFQGNSIARLDSCRVAGQRVTPVVLFVRHPHDVLFRVDAAGNRSLFGRLVKYHDGYDDHRCSHPHDSAHNRTSVNDLPRLCLSGFGEDHTENHNQKFHARDSSGSRCPPYIRAYVRGI